MMSKERVKSTGKQVSGSIKEAVGKITGDTKTEAEGAAEKTVGKAQHTADLTKDKIRDVVDD